MAVRFKKPSSTDAKPTKLDRLAGAEAETLPQAGLSDGCELIMVKIMVTCCHVTTIGKPWENGGFMVVEWDFMGYWGYNGIYLMEFFLWVYYGFPYGFIGMIMG